MIQDPAAPAADGPGQPTWPVAQSRSTIWSKLSPDPA